jgi:anti-sigma factor RsiW
MTRACEELQEQLDAFVDSELDPTRYLALQRHVLTCATCRDAVQDAMEFRFRLHHEVCRVRAPHHLRARVLSMAPHMVDSRERDPRAGLERSGYRWRWPLLGVAATLVVALLGLRAEGPEWVEEYLDRAGVMPLFEDVVRLHSKDLPSEVGESDAAQVASWFRGKVEFPVRPIEFREENAKLVGARIANVREHHAAVLYYTVGGHRVTVTVFASPKPVHRGAKRWKNRQGRELYYRNVNGYVVPVVQERGVTYAWTGDLDPQAQLRLASRARIVY